MKVNSMAIALLLLAASAAAQAADQGVYFGIKGGLMDPKESRLDDAINLGGVIGYNIPGVTQLGGPIGIEGDINLSLVKGDVSGGGDWDVQTFAGYGVYRTGGAAYAKAKVGIAHQRMSVSGAGENDDTSFSYGVGAGLKMGPGRAEVEYTWLHELNFISVAYLF